jgi:hypothetical protein
MRSQFLDGRPLPIFPCQANKRPASPRGFYSASSDPEEIENLWSQWRAPLIGVRTGAASGFAVLDVDRDGLPWFHQHRDRIPKTLTVETPRGGLHLWFQHAEGLRCSISCIARGVDIRADGGYAIFWRAHACAVLCESPVAPWPEWLLGVPPSLLVQSQRVNQIRAKVLKLVETFAEEVVKSAGKEVGKRLVQVPFWLGVLAAIGCVTAALQQWIAVLPH